jgi:hypothetical protein
MAEVFKRDDTLTSAAAELERPVALPASELAAEILPAFGPDGVRGVTGGIGALQVALWLMDGYSRKPRLRPLLVPVQEAIHVLELGGLVRPERLDSGGSRALITPLGLGALNDGTAAERLEGVVAR